MKQLVAVAVILTATLVPAAGASTLRPQSHAIDSVEKGSRRAKVLEKSVRTIAFADATEWVIHPVWAARETSPMGVTRFAADGAPELYLVSDWLPKGSIPRGYVGQVYGVADLEDGGVAATVGWNGRRGDVHNAVLFLERRGANDYHLRATVELPGVADVVRGPAGTAVVVTGAAQRTGGGPLLTVVNPTGVVGEFFTPDTAGDAHLALRNIVHARLQHIGGATYALYDAGRQTLTRFNLIVKREGRAELAVAETFSVDNDPALSAGRVVGLQVAANGSALIARVGRSESGPQTVVTRFSRTGLVDGTWVSQHPWNAVVPRRGGLGGVVSRGAVLVETVTFSDH